MRTGLAPSEAADLLAAALGARTTRSEAGDVFVVLDVPDGPARQIGGRVQGNPFLPLPDDGPEDASVLDGYDTDRDVGVLSRDEEVLRAASRAVFDRLVAALPWPALLLVETDLLVAAKLPGAAAVDFPSGTTPDAADREAWLPFALTGDPGGTA